MRPLRKTLLLASRNAWLAERLPRLRVVRAAVRRFMPGEEIDDALDAARAFRTHGIPAVVSQLGENVTNPGEAAEVQRHYLDVLDRIAGSGLDVQLSIKLTQLGLDIDEDLALEYVRALVERAARLGNTVWIDMEGSDDTDRTIRLFRTVAVERPNVGICVQAYLRRTAADLDALLPITTAIRLVKGAYDEPPDRAFPRKRDVDANYLRLGIRLMRAAEKRDSGHGPVLATHDVRLLDQIFRAAAAGGVPADTCEVQMLYGIRTTEQYRLAREGKRFRVFISYGSAWFRWYLRRLAERPANIGFILRSTLTR